MSDSRGGFLLVCRAATAMLPPKFKRATPMSTLTAMTAQAQRDAGGFSADALLPPAHCPDGLRPQGSEQAARQRLTLGGSESKLLSLSCSIG